MGSNKRHALIARNDSADAKLYDIAGDPGQTQDIAGQEPEIVRRTFDLVMAEHPA